MQVSAHADIDVVAVEQDDQVTVMLELTAPPAPIERPRAPATVQVSLDRSGSMGGERLEAVKELSWASSTASTRPTASALSPSTTRSMLWCRRQSWPTGPPSVGRSRR